MGKGDSVIDYILMNEEMREEIELYENRGCNKFGPLSIGSTIH